MRFTTTKTVRIICAATHCPRGTLILRRNPVIDAIRTGSNVDLIGGRDLQEPYPLYSRWGGLKFWFQRGFSEAFWYGTRRLTAQTVGDRIGKGFSALAGAGLEQEYGFLANFI